uniref:Leucine-rich repeat-containing N-terminal plant-type domain-containing protein n=1 Tax=Araucaria cunninghamii TaxID=56994 RepID=A0A0D6QRW2_ARACU
MPTVHQLAVSMGMAFALAIAMTMHITSACFQNERTSLLHFKAGLVDYKARLSSWSGYNCCQWHGILCHSHSGHVIRLDLHNRRPDFYRGPGSNYLIGTIHQSLFNLQHLQLLDLSYNYFNGSVIPPQLAKLKRLNFLSLSHSGFRGEIPVELGNISTLRHLDLSNNYHIEDLEEVLKSSSFAGWVRNLRSLEYLAMKGVHLTMASERWGDALTSIASLSHVYLSDCRLSGSVPSLLNLTHLSHLHLSGNSFGFPIPEWFQHVSTLVSIDLSECELQGSIPLHFLHRSSLSNIELSYNSQLKGNLSFILNHSSSLTVLSVVGASSEWVDGYILEGVIPPSISNFSKLEKLYLSGNNLTGDVPPFGSALGRLSPLSEIDLSNNNLKGSIPPSVGRLSSLKHLDLSRNRLTGTIPDTISKLGGLQTLLLRFNSFTGNVTLSLFENQTRLKALDLSNNQLSVSISISSSWIPQFADMSYIGLRSCNIEGYLPAFLSSLYFLSFLDLSDNNIVGNIPTWLWDLPNLEGLNLSNNKLEGPVSILSFKSYQVIDLHRNGLQGSLPSISGEYLHFLDLSHNEFNGSIPATMGKVFYLVLSENNLSGGIPDSLCTESPLSLLDLSNNTLTGMISPNVGKCFQLSVLNLAENDFRGEIPKELGKTSLSTLNLNGNHLTGVIPSSIENCTGLQVFDVGHNKFDGSIPAWIGELKSLRILSLTSNNFQGTIPPQLSSLHNLQILDLSCNHFSGFIPQNLTNLHAMVNQNKSNEVQRLGFEGEYIGHVEIFYIVFIDEVTLWMKGQETPYIKIIKALKFIDLSSNELSGSIPWEMGFLKGLISLNISRNNLNSSIPKSLGGMAELEALDLSENKLSGKIPQDLVNLTFLEVLDLSDNHLSGLVPQGKQFLTFDASSFAGNPNLHGPPLDNTTALKAGRSQRGSQQEMNNTKGEAESDADEDDEMDRWWAVTMGLSFGVGFGVVLGVLCFHIRWGIKYFAVLDAVVGYLFDCRLGFTVEIRQRYS